MEQDDEVVVIIVSDENESSLPVPLVNIKTELEIERLEDFEVDIPSPAYEGSVTEQDDDTVIIKEEILDEDVQNEEVEYLYDEDDVKQENEEQEDLQEVGVLEEENDWSSEDEHLKLRRKQLRPCQRRSFVADLREQYPELAKDRELLVNSLAEIMRSIKPPPLPDHYVINGIMLECTVCGGLTETIPAAGRHYQEKHGPRYLICFSCGVDFRSATNLYKHEKRCHGPDAVYVLKARAIVVGNKGRRRPFLQARNQRPRNSLVGPVPTKKGYQCEQCPSTFNSKTALESHIYLHSGKRPFRCKYCPCAYTSHSALWRHSKRHSGVKYICDHCEREFNVKAALVSHMDTHLPYRKHVCPHCGRGFAQKSALALHVNGKHLHLPPPCACQLCPKRFRRMTLLKDHMKKVHGMLLMTRKMFFKKLPMMTDTQLEQAKIIFKSDEVDIKPVIKHETADDVNEQFLNFIRETYNHNGEVR